MDHFIRVPASLPVVTLVLVALTAAGDVAGQPPVTDEILVNARRQGKQSRPDVAVRDSGDFLVVWQGPDPAGDCEEIFGRHSSPAGLLGPETRLNSYTTACQARPAVALLEDGDFVVVWQSGSQDGDGSGIVGRLFGGDLEPRTGEIQVNTYTTGDQRRPDVAPLAGGGFVVVWESDGQDGHGSGIFGQRFDDAGSAVATELQVNQSTAFSQVRPSVDGAPDGGFVAAWRTTNESSKSRVVGRVFNADGSPRSGFQADQVTGYDFIPQEHPAVSVAPNGTFVVAWREFYYLAGTGSPRGQAFDGEGDPLSEPMKVAFTAYSSPPAVSHDGLGDFSIVWSGELLPGVWGRTFDPNFVTVSEVVVSSYQDRLFSETPQVDHRPGTDNFVVVWSRGDYHHEDDDIFARVFGATIFRDGFESGDTAAWTLP